jgi:hypothetical protein
MSRRAGRPPTRSPADLAGPAGRCRGGRDRVPPAAEVATLPARNPGGPSGAEV